MKAKIDGIELEGTPEEILKFKSLYEEKRLTEKSKTIINPTINPFGTKTIDCIGKDWGSTGKNPYEVKFDSEQHLKSLESIKIDNK